MSIKKEIMRLKQEMDKEGIFPENGLGEELFLFSSTLMPVTNVDLLVYNDKKEILLCWRDDLHCGRGWHVPGGCLRFKETLETRIQKTALKELGSEVEFVNEPIKVFEIVSSEKRKGIIDQRERAHFITLVYACRLKDKIFQTIKPGEVGYMQWFYDPPENLLEVQKCYKEKWSELREKL